MQNKIFLLSIVLCLFFSSFAKVKKRIFYSKEFSVYSNKVKQASFTGKAISSTSMTSNYLSPDANKYSPTVQFKFSINSRDNEMATGKNHIVTLQPKNGRFVTNVEFGNQMIEIDKNSEKRNLPKNTIWTIKLDMRKVLSSFQEKGFYTLYNGEKISKADFKGVYIAGGSAPLSWDFSNLSAKPHMELKDNDGNGIYEISFKMNSGIDLKQIDNKWELSSDLSALPQYNSDFQLSNAVYNLSLEEMLKAVEPDSTFRTGKEWAGVWTRDISYSIILSMAYMQPKVAKYSLMRKVKNDRIIQDTGTGGSYPVSTDRIVWATAAWELYKATGDNDWLKYAFKVIKNSIEDDLKNAYDPITGMVKGESSFLDWREQTYPKWMQPVDIYESENLGTNAIHYNANIVLAKMANLLHDSETEKKHNEIATKIKDGINKYLWIKEKGYYGQYIYGRNNMILSERSEALGEALCVLFGIADADRSKMIIANTPILNWGIPCLYPQIPGIYPYHNNAIWPFVQSYWALAAAKTGNQTAVLQQIAAIYRTTSIFLTNKENMVAETGDFAGTAINSSRMLWSLSGNIALVHKLLFGIGFQSDRLTFNPCVPKELGGNRSLKNFKYRNAFLNIDLSGYGSKIKSFKIDNSASEPEVLCTLTGKHEIEIVLDNEESIENNIHKVKNAFSPETPKVIINNNQLVWEKANDAESYIIIKNGEKIGSTTLNSTDIPDQGAEYQVISKNKAGFISFASEPISVCDTFSKIVYQIEDYGVKSELNGNDFNENGFVEISKTANLKIEIPIEIQHPGKYTLQFRYANGSGHIHSDNKCAMRNLNINGRFAGTIVLPQRGENEWSNWGYSNIIKLNLAQGKNILAISFEANNQNMNVEINKAMLDEVILIENFQ